MSAESKLHEAIADIAYMAGQMGYYTGDSREDISHFIYLAEKFEREHDFDWDESERVYMLEIEDFVVKELGGP
jgi:hypothetical protein